MDYAGITPADGKKSINVEEHLLTEGAHKIKVRCVQTETQPGQPHLEFRVYGKRDVKDAEGVIKTIDLPVNIIGGRLSVGTPAWTEGVYQIQTRFTYPSYGAKGTTPATK